MKKLILLIAATAGLANITLAQDLDTDFRDRLSFGLKAGINYSNIYDTEGETFSNYPKLGFATGAFLAIPINKYLGIQPEILFSQKGFEAKGTMFGSTYSFSRTTNYIDIPLLFAYKPAGIVTILFGPQYSYLLKQKDVFTNAAMSVEQEKVFENNNVRLNTLGFVGGVDVTVKHFLLGARLSADVQNNNANGTTTTPRYKNVLFQATIGYRFYNN